MRVNVCCTELYAFLVSNTFILVMLFDDFIFEDFYSKPGNFCHPNTNMSSTKLEKAMQECHDDPSCNAFYKVCSYERYRKCNDTAYEEDSECGLVGNSSFLYIKGI